MNPEQSNVFGPDAPHSYGEPNLEYAKLSTALTLPELLAGGASGFSTGLWTGFCVLLLFVDWLLLEDCELLTTVFVVTTCSSISITGASSDTYKFLMYPSVSPFLTFNQLSCSSITSTLVANSNSFCISDSILASFLKFTLSAVI